jgi:hypothetical protein
MRRTQLTSFLDAAIVLAKREWREDCSPTDDSDHALFSSGWNWRPSSTPYLGALVKKQRRISFSEDSHD